MKKELFIPIVIIALGAAFVVVSALVFINGGRSAKLISRKIRLGALLLTFNSMIWGASGQDEIRVECYISGPPFKGTVQFLGPEVNINKSNSNNISTQSQLSPNSKKFDLTGTGFSAGLFVWVPFGGIVENRHSLTISLGYSSFNNSASTLINDYNYNSTVLSGDLSGNGLLEDNIESSLSCLSLKTMYSYRLVDQLIISAGPGVLWVINNDLDEELKLKSTNNVSFSQEFHPLRYENNRQTAVLSEGAPSGARDFLFNLNAEVYYEWATGCGYDIMPYVGYSYNLTKVTERLDWTMSSFYAGVSLRFKIKHTWW